MKIDCGKQWRYRESIVVLQERNDVVRTTVLAVEVRKVGFRVYF